MARTPDKTVYRHWEADGILRSRNEKRIAGNTWLVRLDDDRIAVRFWSTNIVIIHRDGTYTVDCQGYRSATTKARVNQFSPIGVYQHKHQWRLSSGLAFYDGLRCDHLGNVIPRTEEEGMEIAAADGCPAAKAALADYRAGLR